MSCRKHSPTAEIVLSVSNKVTHEIEFIHRLNTALDSRNCRNIARGAEGFPVNPAPGAADPRGLPPAPVRPAMPPGNAAAVREQNRMAHDNYKLEVSIYQFTVGQLKADKESWTTRQAEGFKYLKSHLSYGMQRDLYVVADRGDLRDLNQTVEQLLDNRHEYDFSSMSSIAAIYSMSRTVADITVPSYVLLL